MSNKFNYGDRVEHINPNSTLSLNPDGNTMISGLLQGEFIEVTEVCSFEDLVHSQS